LQKSLEKKPFYRQKLSKKTTLVFNKGAPRIQNNLRILIELRYFSLLSLEKERNQQLH